MMASNSMETKEPSRVLLAEDDTALRTVVAESLREQGYDVTECRDGVELLGHLAGLQMSHRTLPEEEQDVDIIISDIRMPGVNGLSILEGVREDDTLPPMILITAFGDDRTHEAAEKHGAAAIFDKPFDMDQLLARVCELVPPYRQGEANDER